MRKKNKLETKYDYYMEFRSRFIYVLIFYLLSFILFFFLGNKLFFIIAYPLNTVWQTSGINENYFIYTGLFEKFLSNIDIAFLFSSLLVIPFIMWQIWGYTREVLYHKERKFMIVAMILGILFFVLGIAFAYFLVLPVIYKFFLHYQNFSNTKIVFRPRVKEYVQTFTKIILLFGVLFEFPVFILLFGKIGLINRKMLKKKRKYAILIIFILAAIFSPPDPFSQILLAIPLILLFELSLILLKVFVYDK